MSGIPIDEVISSSRASAAAKDFADREVRTQAWLAGYQPPPPLPWWVRHPNLAAAGVSLLVFSVLMLFARVL